jgi:hypothetical protein
LLVPPDALDQKAHAVFLQFARLRLI